MEREPAIQEQRGEQSKLNGGVSVAIGEQIGSRRSVLTDLGVEFPEGVFQRKKISWKDLEKELKQETDDKKLQGILNNTPVFTIVGYIRYKKEHQTPVLLDFLTSILRAKELHVRPKDVSSIVVAVRDAGIPVKREYSGYKLRSNGQEYPQTYCIVVVKHTDRILEALRTNTELFARLNDNPVKLAYGPGPDTYPNTTKLVKKRGHAHIGNIINKHFGITVHSSYSDLLVGSPVSIFNISGRGYLCSLGDLNIFLPFLEKRLKDLGKIK